MYSFPLPKKGLFLIHWQKSFVQTIDVHYFYHSQKNHTHERSMDRGNTCTYH